MSVPILIIFALGLSVLMLYIPSAINNRMMDSVQAAAQQTAAQFKIIRKYYVENVVNVVVKGSDLRPAINHKGNDQAIPLPATMIHDLSDLLQKEGTRVYLYSVYPFPNRSQRQLDPFQKTAWEYINKNPGKTYAEIEVKDTGTVMRVAVADKMVTQACVDCHNAHPDTPRNDWKLDEVRGVLEITTDISKQMAANQSTSRRIMLVLVVLLAGLIVAIYLVYKYVVDRKLHRVVGAIEQLADGRGDLTTRLDDRGTDELSGLARSLNRFIEQHQKFIAEIATSVDTLTISSREMKNVTIDTAQEILNQQAKTDMIATAINEMAATVQEVARNAASAEQTAVDTNSAAVEGQKIVSASIQSIRSLAAEVENATQVISRLHAHSENIGSVLDVIKNIAEQTNLLALNAAIEAARAGEQGRGFAVVADEVRTLASRTQQSTREIQEMIEQLQTGAKDAVEVMGKGRSAAEDSVSQSAATGESLDEIKRSIEAIASINTRIATAAEEQSHVAAEIKNNIDKINNIAKQTTIGADKTSAASAKLTGIADTLKGLIRNFKY